MYQSVNAAILAAADGLTLEPGWDGEGAVRPEPAALLRAVIWLKDMEVLLGRCGRRPDPPHDIDISPCPDGSFDLDWRRGGYELLVNFDPDPGKLHTFYGDDGKKGDSVNRDAEGGASDDELLSWLAQNFR